MTTTTTRPASEKQIAFATKLGQDVAQRELDADQTVTLNTLRSTWKFLLSDGKAMSAAIDMLLDIKKHSRRGEAARPSETATEAPEGMHRLGETIYKVQRAVHGSGNLYAKKLVQYGDEWTFEFEPGAIRRLSEATKLTLEEAKAFGALYGTCCVCGRTLTNEESIEAGIGPICSSKF